MVSIILLQRRIRSFFYLVVFGLATQTICISLYRATECSPSNNSSAFHDHFASNNRNTFRQTMTLWTFANSDSDKNVVSCLLRQRFVLTMTTRTIRNHGMLSGFFIDVVVYNSIIALSFLDHLLTQLCHASLLEI